MALHPFRCSGCRTRFYAFQGKLRTPDFRFAAPVNRDYVVEQGRPIFVGMMAVPVEIDFHQLVLPAHRRPFFESSSHASYIETSPEASRADLKLRPHVTQAGNGSGIGLITSASGSSGSGIVTGGGCGGNFCGSGSGGGSFGSGSAMQFHSYAFPVVHSGETYRT